MKKQLLILMFILPCVVSTNVYAQFKNTMRTFDIKRYDLNKDEIGNYKYTENDSTYILFQVSDHYAERVMKKNSPTYESYVYYNNGKLKSRLLSFYECSIGKFYEYDSTGNLINEIDYDAPYIFTCEDLVEKIDKEFKINLLIKDECTVVTRTFSSPYIYYISICNYAKRKGEEFENIRIEVDGIIGETIYFKDYDDKIHVDKREGVKERQEKSNKNNKGLLSFLFD